jgi:hypothetical protein
MTSGRNEKLICPTNACGYFIVMTPNRQSDGDDEARDDQRDPSTLGEFLDGRHCQDACADRESGGGQRETPSPAGVFSMP